MISINLVPDVKQELIQAQKARSTVITIAILAGIASLAVITILAVYVFVVQTARGAISDGEIDSLSQELSEVEDLGKTLTMQNQLATINTLNEEKQITSRVFGLLNAITPEPPNDIGLSNLNLDTEQNLITIEGQAENSYTAVEIFQKTIEGAQIRYTDQNGEVQEVQLASEFNTSNTSYGEDASGRKVLRFTLSFVYDPQLFAFNAQDAEIVITTTGNVTDSRLGVPDSIFVERANDLEEE